MTLGKPAPLFTNHPSFAMKKAFLLFTLLSAFGSLWAQDTTAPQKLITEVALQTNALFDRLLKDDEGSLSQNPYLLTGKLVYGRLALRAGIGGSYKKLVKRETGFADSQTTLDQSFDLRLGLERQFELGPRWTGTVGLDGMGSWAQQKNIDDSGFDVITVSEDLQSFGGGLVSGLQFKLTERFSLYTEGFVYFATGNITSGRFFQNFPIFDDEKKKTETSELKIGLPSSLYVVFRF